MGCGDASLSQRGSEGADPEKVIVSVCPWHLYFVLPLCELHSPEDAVQKTLTKHGNSYALVIDKPILDLLRITPETPFEIVSDGQSLVLTPIRDPKEERKFQKALETLHERFGRTLQKLAE